MNRRTFLCGLTLGPLAAPLAAGAQAAGKVPRIGVLITGSESSSSTNVGALRRGLRDHGYVEGGNIVIEYRYGDGNTDRLPKLAAELVGLDVALIVTSGTPPTRAAQSATSTIPIVMTVVGDPTEVGFIASLARPGGQITGLTQLTTELNVKRLELLKEAFPRSPEWRCYLMPHQGCLRLCETSRRRLGRWVSTSCLSGCGVPTRIWKGHSERQQESALVLC
jgi:ABC-type uncharacterized transport system substrate-binding protein